jgi:hypothetical protein
MPDQPKDVSEFLEKARHRQSSAVQQQSKLEPHREAILAAVAAKIPITSIRETLAEDYSLQVSYSNLRSWIRRQPKGASSKPTKAKGAPSHGSAKPEPEVTEVPKVTNRPDVGMPGD